MWEFRNIHDRAKFKVLSFSNDAMLKLILNLSEINFPLDASPATQKTITAILIQFSIFLDYLENEKINFLNFTFFIIPRTNNKTGNIE